MKNISISQRLNKTKKTAVKLEIINEWLASWHKEQTALIRLAEDGKHNAFDALIALTNKKIKALINILPKLIEANNNDRI
jgi:hypothetical protein